MQLLEYFYELSPKNNTFYPRKLLLPEDQTFLLSGARGTGKTTLIIEYLQDLPYESWIYIDCQDPIFALEDIDVETLHRFIELENIETVVLDHYYHGFLEELPKCFQLIVIDRDASSADIALKRTLYPLDYEEYLSFDKSSSSASVSFNHFLKAGTLPMATNINSQSLSLTMRTFFYSSFDEDESRLMLILAKYQGHRITTNQIYLYARDYFRISKDWVYKTIKRFNEEGLILFIDDAERKGAKKMVLYDFALSKYLSKSQPFSITFDAIVALALFKHDIEFETLGIHGYLIQGSELIIPSAFESEENFWKKSYNKMVIYRKYHIRKITIVTISNTYSFTLNDIFFEAMPFYEWSILNENNEYDIIPKT